jgi:ketosteroid isomerase-like protein
MTNANVEVAKQYLHAIASNVSGADLAKFFGPGMTIEEKPNRIYPNGQTRDVTAMLHGLERGKKMLKQQRYEVLHATAEGNRVALEVLWEGVLAMPLGTLAAGATMRAHSGMFLEFRDGKIISQRNYDCFEPF